MHSTLWGQFNALIVAQVAANSVTPCQILKSFSFPSAPVVFAKCLLEFSINEQKREEGK